MVPLHAWRAGLAGWSAWRFGAFAGPVSTAESLVGISSPPAHIPTHHTIFKNSLDSLPLAHLSGKCCEFQSTASGGWTNERSNRHRSSVSAPLHCGRFLFLPPSAFWNASQYRVPFAVFRSRQTLRSPAHGSTSLPLTSYRPQHFAHTYPRDALTRGIISFVVIFHSESNPSRHHRKPRNFVSGKTHASNSKMSPAQSLASDGRLLQIPAVQIGSLPSASTVRPAVQTASCLASIPVYQ